MDAYHTAKEETMKTDMMDYRIIFDNAGGVVLQLSRYAAYYRDPEDAAADLLEYLRDGTADGWDHPDPEDERAARELDPTIEEVQRGCYRIVCDVDELDPESSWYNQSVFAKALARG